VVEWKPNRWLYAGWQRSGGRVEFLDALHHVGLLVFGELGVDGQRQRLLGRALRVRERARPIAEVLVADLEMQRQRVVDLGADSLLLQEGPKLVPLGTRPDLLPVNIRPRFALRADPGQD